MEYQPIKYPAFIDSHSHLSGVAGSLLQADLTHCENIEELLTKLNEFTESPGFRKEDWVIGRGDDFIHSLNDEILNKILPETPVVIQHTSGHFGCFNGASAALLGISAGCYKENIYFSHLSKVPLPNTEAFLAAYNRAQRKYASAGYTTVQEGMITIQMIPILRELINRNQFFLDVVGYASLSDADEIFSAFQKHTARYRHNFRLGGVKIFLDGSLQAGTAWMTNDYTFAAKEGLMTDKEVIEAVQYARTHRIQLLAHCNGNAAAEQLVRCVSKVCEAYPEASGMRTVMIHAQALPIRLMPELKRYGIIPSFFVSHIRVYGDMYLSKFGNIASSFSPIASAYSAGLMPTIHEDSPVIPPNALLSVKDSALRKTAGGVQLDENEKIKIKEALTCVTRNAAYQYFEENEKGRIHHGYRNDYILLDRDPLMVEPEDLDKIKILETVKDGKTVYSA